MKSYFRQIYGGSVDPRQTFEGGKQMAASKTEIIFIDEDTLTPEEWEAIADEQTEE